MTIQASKTNVTPSRLWRSVGAVSHSCLPPYPVPGWAEFYITNGTFTISISPARLNQS